MPKIPGSGTGRGNSTTTRNPATCVSIILRCDLATCPLAAEDQEHAGAPSNVGCGSACRIACGWCHNWILGKPSSTRFAKIFVTSKPINMFQFDKLIIYTNTRLVLHQTRTNTHPWTNMQGVIRVGSTTRTIGQNTLYRTLLTPQHIVIQLDMMHLKFLSECLSRLPCPHLVLHPQEVLDHRTPQLLNPGRPTTLSRTSTPRPQPLQSQRPYLTRRLG